jgi:hypothetical protein
MWRFTPACRLFQQMTAVVSCATAGPQSEVLLLPVFAELASLLPQHQLDIHLIGPDVPEQLHAQACTAANLHGEAHICQHVALRSTCAP